MKGFNSVFIVAVCGHYLNAIRRDSSIIVYGEANYRSNVFIIHAKIEI